MVQFGVKQNVLSERMTAFNSYLILNCTEVKKYHRFGWGVVLVQREVGMFSLQSLSLNNNAEIVEINTALVKNIWSCRTVTLMKVSMGVLCLCSDHLPTYRQ